jgi:hypothetical protein
VTFDAEGHSDQATLQLPQSQLRLSSDTENCVRDKDKGLWDLGGNSLATQVKNIFHFNCIIELSSLPTRAAASVPFNLHMERIVWVEFVFPGTSPQGPRDICTSIHHSNTASSVLRENYVLILQWQLTSIVHLIYMKVAGSIPDELLGFFDWPNPSSSIISLGSTHLLTEMSTKNFPGGRGRPAS